MVKNLTFYYRASQFATAIALKVIKYKAGKQFTFHDDAKSQRKTHGPQKMSSVSIFSLKFSSNLQKTCLTCRFKVCFTATLRHAWPGRCASRDSTNQNASFVEWFSRSERAVFRGIRCEIFALFQACVGNFDNIPPWKVVGTLYLNSSCVTFKYFAFLSVCDKFELLGHVQAAMMIWVLFFPFFLDLLQVTVSGFIELFWPSCYFNLSSLQISGSTRVYPC